MTQENQRIKSITEFLPILSIILIFIGYYDYYSYYINFDIEIHNYLTTGELLLSFLPISIYLIIAFVLIFVFTVTAKASEREEESYYNQFKKSFRIIIFKEKYSGFIKYCFAIVDFVIRLCGYLFFILFTILIIYGIRDKDSKLYDLKIIMIYIFIVWYTMLDSYIEKLVKMANVKINSTIYRYSTLLLLFLSIITLINTTKSFKINKGESQYSVEFNFNNEIFKTDSNRIYIGMTQEYMFIRDISQKNNLIFKRSDISGLLIRKNETDEK